MSSCTAQAVIDAPVERVWALLTAVERYPEWWPRVDQVTCDHPAAEGCSYTQVTAGRETTLMIEAFDDCRALAIRCLDTGTYTNFSLAPAQGATYVEAEFGMHPTRASFRLWDALGGRRYFRRWLDESLAGLNEAAGYAQLAQGAEPRRA